MVAYCILILCCLGGESESESESYSRGRNLESITDGVVDRLHGNYYVKNTKKQPESCFLKF